MCFDWAIWTTVCGLGMSYMEVTSKDELTTQMK